MQSDIVTRDLTLDVIRFRAERAIAHAILNVDLDVLDADRLYDALDGVQAAQNKRDLLLALDVALLGYIPGGVHNTIESMYRTVQDSL